MHPISYRLRTGVIALIVLSISSLVAWAQPKGEGENPRGYLGVLVNSETPEGIVVEEVAPDSPAHKSGLKRGDRIVKVDEEEVREADLLLHVVDASHPEAEAQIVAVHEVLEEIGAHEVPEQIVLNKIDRADPATLDALVRRLVADRDADPVLVSARTGEGLADLAERIQLRLPSRRLRVTGHVPYERQDLVALAHRSGEVHKESHTETGTTLVADVDVDVAHELRDYLDVDPFADETEDWER